MYQAPESEDSSILIKISQPFYLQILSISDFLSFSESLIRHYYSPFHSTLHVFQSIFYILHLISL